MHVWKSYTLLTILAKFTNKIKVSVDLGIPGKRFNLGNIKVIFSESNFLSIKEQTISQGKKN